MPDICDVILDEHEEFRRRFAEMDALSADGGGRGAIRDFRVNAPPEQRERLGACWIGYEVEHAGGRGIDTSDRDREDFISRHRSG